MLSRLVVQSQPMISMALAGRNVQKMPIRQQIIRQFNRDSRETITRSERIAQRQTLKERIMAPAGPNGNFYKQMQSYDIDQSSIYCNEFGIFQHLLSEKVLSLVAQHLAWAHCASTVLV